MPKKKTRHVLITTEYRGVYFGELESHDAAARSCYLVNARMAIYWGTTRGVDQLADTGPTEKSRIGAVAPRIWVCGLTSVAECTPQAVAAWKAAK